VTSILKQEIEFVVMLVIADAGEAVLYDVQKKIPAHRSETDHSELCLSHI
jgi:hypothetical protein